MKFKINNRWNGDTRFECDLPAEVAGKNHGEQLGYAIQQAYKSGINLIDADLARANLAEANSADLAIARTRILPDGDLIGWKKCQDGVIVKLRIPADARRYHAFGRKCRAEFADVLEVIGAEVGISQHNRKTKYRVGERVVPHRFDNDWRHECAPGIHFFITRAEAEAHW